MNNSEKPKIIVERKGNNIELHIYPPYSVVEEILSRTPPDQDPIDVPVDVLGLSISGARKLAHDILKELDED